MNYKERIILLSNNLLSGILNSIYFVYPSFYHFNSSIYFFIVFISYFGSILSSIIFGNIKVNGNNYIKWSLVGIAGPLLSILFLFYPNTYLYIFSYLLFSFTYYSTYFVFLLYYKDVKLNFYFNIYWTIGEIIPQISLLFVSIMLNLYIISILLLLSILVVLSREIYMFLFTEAYELNLLVKIDKIFSQIDHDISNFGTLVPLFEGLLYPINIRKLKFGYIELYNFFVLIGFSLVWSSLVFLVDKINLGNIYPLLLFINGLYTSIFYKIYKRTINNNNVNIGILSRLSMGVILIIFSVIYSVLSIPINGIIMTVLFILAAYSWTMFQFFFDNFIIIKYPEKFGNVYFFRNLGGMFGSIILLFISLFNGLILSLAILGISIFFFRSYFKKVI
ncbi:hypothetical protein MJ1_0502 [Nanobdella aerobiophila]|uniref:Uncharacterized protein n=1 Tax=Nanobdella aerobiophila TaxID=2586965 RepID=A0A915WSU2_9ARCH|nr:hypothetical protein [Nanobdella aerobiophila]BBL45655.1 hypothetical protein MJ1_0502 [Nanobdella aerobiophila]